MKNMIRILSLVTLLALCLAGCGRPEPPLVRPPVVTHGGNQSGNQQYANRIEMDGYYLQSLPEEVENPEGLPVLKWVCLTEYHFGGRDRCWNEEAMHEINKMLEQRGLPFRIQFIMLTHPKYDNEWLSKPGVLELLADADLIFADLSAEEMTKYLSPITRYINGSAEPSLEYAVPHSINWRRATVDGEVYGIPTVANQAYVMAWNVGAGILEKYGLKATEFSADIEKMETLFARIYAQNGNRPFLYAREGHMNYLLSEYGIQNATYPVILSPVIDSACQRIGSCFALDLSSGTPKVVSTLELDYIRAWQQAILRFRDAGYVTKDPHLAEISLCTDGTDCVYTTSDGSVRIPVGAPVFPYETAYGMVSGISASSDNQEAAVTLLSLIASDEEFRMQLLYGEEGRDYTIEDGFYTITQQADGTNYSLDFLSPLSYFCGLTANPDSGFMPSPGTANLSFPERNGKTKLETYQETLDHSTAFLPIVFDFSGLKTELSQIDELMRQYFAIFTNNVQIEDDPKTSEDEFVPRMDEENYQIMLAKIKAAGGDKIQAELQRQLDEWLAANPDWNK